MMTDIVLVEGVRTAIGKYGGSFKKTQVYELATYATKGLLQKTGIDPKEVDGAIFGCCGQFGKNQWTARIAALESGLSIKSSALMVNRQCASGLQAIMTSAMTIDHGDAEILIAGGCESMSSYPYALNGARWGYRMNNAVAEDLMVSTLTCPFNDYHYGITAENIVEKYGITRQAQDAYALRSQQRALEAIREGKFKDEIIPVEVRDGKKTRVFDTDEGPRETSMEILAALPAAFKKDGTVTAGNSSSINDAAAATLIMRGTRARELGLKPKLRVVDYAVAGVPPEIMGIGPYASTVRLLEKTGLSMGDIGLVELNEAFAAQTIACIRELCIDEEKVNVNGSGISLGHPTGATGCILTVKLANEMRRRNVCYGLVTMCIGGGQGMSGLFELLD